MLNKIHLVFNATKVNISIVTLAWMYVPQTLYSVIISCNKSMVKTSRPAVRCTVNYTYCLLNAIIYKALSVVTKVSDNTSACNIYAQIESLDSNKCSILVSCSV